MKLYVGNLPWSIDDEGLKKLFSSYGADEANLITDKFTRRSKGFGFVTINDEESAKKAISEMEGKDVEGRPLRVSEARPMTPREGSDDRPQSRNDSGSSEAPSADPEAVQDAVEDSVDEEEHKAEESVNEHEDKD